MDYASKLMHHFGQGYEVVNLKRFVFYLDSLHTSRFLQGSSTLDAMPPLAVTQNCEGGGSIAVFREAFEKIGGMDESFIGWGGEDNEWWERAQTLRVWPYAYLPIVHLWHAPQPGRQQAGFHTQAHYQALSGIPVATRIDRLLKIKSGQRSGPTGTAL